MDSKSVNESPVQDFWEQLGGNFLFFLFFFMGNINSLPQEKEEQQERQNKGKRHLATILPSHEQQPKIDPS